MKYCSNCGTQLFQNQNFCNECGNKVFSEAQKNNVENNIRISNFVSVPELNPEIELYRERNDSILFLLNEWKNEYKKNLISMIVVIIVLFAIYLGLEYLNQYVIEHSPVIPLILPIFLFLSGLFLIIAIFYVLATPFVTLIRSQKTNKIKHLLTTSPSSEIESVIETEQNDKGKITETLILTFLHLNGMKIKIKEDISKDRKIREYDEIIKFTI